jgi:hypothetical protein
MKWMSRLEVVEQRWDWAGVERGWVCFVFSKGPTLGRHERTRVSSKPHWAAVEIHTWAALGPRRTHF